MPYQASKRYLLLSDCHPVSPKQCPPKIATTGPATSASLSSPSSPGAMALIQQGSDYGWGETLFLGITFSPTVGPRYTLAF